MKEKTNIWKKAGVLALATVLVTIAFAGNINAKENEKYNQIQYDYEILWTRDWFDGDVAGTSGGKVAVDSEDNVIVNANSGAINKDIIMKYDADGNTIWESEVDIDGLGYIDEVNLAEYIEEHKEP